MYTIRTSCAHSFRQSGWNLAC